MQDLIEGIIESPRVALFTGAGISTDSGIPDYRGTGGRYERYQPVYFQEFLASEQKRREYWAHKASVWPALRDARPGAAHQLAAELGRRGTLVGVITQNIDGLHEKAGLTADQVVNLHGSNLEIECIDCGRRQPAGRVLDHMEGLQADAIAPPTCEFCGGFLKPTTVMFGQNLRSPDMARAEKVAMACEIMIALGSTLSVYPAAGFPIEAKRNGAALAIVTRGPTPLDDYADYRIDGDIAPFCEAVLAELA